MLKIDFIGYDFVKDPIENLRNNSSIGSQVRRDEIETTIN